MNCQIALNIEDDTDLAAFAATCRSSRAAVYGLHSIIWPERFRQHFCVTGQFDSNFYRTIYTERRRALRLGARFECGQTIRERYCIAILQDLICCSFSDGKTFRRSLADFDRSASAHSSSTIPARIFSNDTSALTTFLYRHDLLSNVLCAKFFDDTSGFLRALQVGVPYLEVSMQAPSLPHTDWSIDRFLVLEISNPVSLQGLELS